jgi:ferredoxin-type protein NapG
MSETPEKDQPERSHAGGTSSEGAASSEAAAAPPEKLPGKAEPVTHTPVQRVDPRKSRASKVVDTRPAEERRDFFSEAMREALIPLSGLLERRINPILAALEAIPDDVERMTKQLPKIAGTLDQPAPEAPRYGPPEEPEAPPRVLRPPGAAQGELESLCSRCGKCVEVCPAKAIRLDFSNLLGQGLPYIDPLQQPCVVCDSLACMHECPTGALKLTERLKIRMGTAKVNLDLCRRQEGEDCRLCLEACPIMGEGAGEHGDALGIHASNGRILVRKNACVGCGLCENQCPTRPAAIEVMPYKPPVDPMIA